MLRFPVSALPLDSGEISRARRAVSPNRARVSGRVHRPSRIRAPRQLGVAETRDIRTRPTELTPNGIRIGGWQPSRSRAAALNGGGWHPRVIARRSAFDL